MAIEQKPLSTHATKTVAPNGRSSVLKAFFSVSFVFAFGMPVALAVNVILARWLSVEQFGQYNFSIALATVIAIPVSGGLPLLLTREVSKTKQTGNYDLLPLAVFVAVAWVLTASLVVAAVGGIFIAFFANDRTEILVLTIAMVPAIGLLAVNEGVLKGLGKPALAEASRQLVVAPILLAGVFLLSRHGEPTASSVLIISVLTYTIVAMVTLSLVMLRLPIHLCRPSVGPDLLCDWARAFYSFALISGMSALSAQIAVIGIGLFDTQQEVAIFRVADRGAQLVGLPLMFINTVLGPRIVAAHRNEGLAGLHVLSRQAARITLFASAPLALALIAFREPLVAATFGPDYVKGVATPIILLVVGQLICVCFGSPGLILVMTDLERNSIVAQLWGVGIMVPTVLILAALFGACGASIGVAAGLLAINVFTSVTVRRNLGFFPGVV